MPRYVQPANSRHAEDPISALGNIVNASIIGHLRARPNQTSGEITAALEVSKTTIARALDALLELGLISADPPRDQAGRGQWIRYRVEDQIVSELYLQLGQAIGEI